MQQRSTASPTISPLGAEGHLWASGPFIEDGVLKASTSKHSH
jgi:hypothetical protein